MNHSHLVQKVFEMLKTHTLNYQIDSYLKASSLTEKEVESIKEEAQKLYAAYRREAILNRNKITFNISAIVAILSVFYFFFFLPTQNIVLFVSPIAIFGSLLLCLALYNLFIFRGARKSDEIAENPTLDFDFSNFFGFFAVLAIIPGVLFYFLISWRIESGAEQKLLETKIEAKGLVISGAYYESKSIRRRRPDDAEITIKFKTKDNRIIKRTIEIPTYQFQHYYKGQEVNLIYSSENPENIMLLNEKSALQKVYQSEERDIRIADLLLLVDAPDIELDAQLNAISYGWNYDFNQKGWINASRNCMIKKEQNTLFYIPKKEMTMLLDNDIRKNKFRRVSENQHGALAQYEKDNFEIQKLSIKNGNDYVVFYSVLNRNKQKN